MNIYIIYIIIIYIYIDTRVHIYIIHIYYSCGKYQSTDRLYICDNQLTTGVYTTAGIY